MHIALSTRIAPSWSEMFGTVFLHFVRDFFTLSTRPRTILYISGADASGDESVFLYLHTDNVNSLFVDE